MTLPPPAVGLIRLGALGDLVLISSLSQALAAAGHRVVLITDLRYQAIARRMPGVERTVLFDRRRHDSVRGLRALARETGALDLALDLQNKPRTALLGRMLRARQLRSLRLRSTADALCALLGRDRVLVDRHQIARNLELVDDVVTVDRPPRPRLEAARQPARRVALAVGAAHAAKRWPAERFGALARWFFAQGYEVRVLVGPGEEALLQALQVAAGRALPSTLGQGVEAILDACCGSALVVSNDSGPAHLAAAVGTPVVSLFGPTSWRRWRPLGSGEVLSLELPCQPCSNHGRERCPLQHHRCLRDLDVERVAEACRRALDTTARPPP
jgi:heptosyltransferase-2